MNRKMMLITAFPADALMHAGGSLLKYLENGTSVSLLILSDGLKASSAYSFDEIEADAAGCSYAIRKEFSKLYSGMGVSSVRFLMKEGYPLPENPETISEVAELIRREDPDCIITHAWEKDFSCPDYSTVSNIVLRAADAARSEGEGRLPVFGMEPFRPELTGWHPDLMLDITDYEEKKEDLLSSLRSVKPDTAFLSQRARARGVHASGRGGKLSCRYAEAFSRRLPICTEAYLVW